MKRLVIVGWSSRGDFVALRPHAALLRALLETFRVRPQYEDVDDDGPVLRYMTVEVRLNESVFSIDYQEGKLSTVSKAWKISCTSQLSAIKKDIYICVCVSVNIKDQLPQAALYEYRPFVIATAR